MCRVNLIVFAAATYEVMRQASVNQGNTDHHCQNEHAYMYHLAVVLRCGMHAKGQLNKQA